MCIRDRNISLISEPTLDNKVHVSPGEGIDYSLTGDPVEVQWRTWDMRDTWMDLVGHDLGDDGATITHTMLVDRLQELPDVEIEGNHTILLRSIRGPNASANMVTHIHVMGSEPIQDVVEETSSTVFALSAIIVLMSTIIGGLLIILMRNSNYEEIPFEEKNEDASDIDFKDEFDSVILTSHEKLKSTEASYSQMTVRELKEILSERNMSTSGRKADLIQRLLDE